MNDTDSSNPFESPKQPSTAPYVDDPIRYEATPTTGDLNHALRSVFSIISSSTLLALLLLGFVAALAMIAKNGMKSSELAFLIGIGFFGLLIAMRVFALLYPARHHLRWNPTATTLQTGELNNQGLLIQCQDQVSWHPHGSIQSCKSKNNRLVLCYDPQRAAVQVLLNQGFQRPQQAIQLLDFHAKQPTPLDMTKLFEGPIMIGEQPIGSIAFDGMLKTIDFKNSPLAKIHKHSIMRMVIWILILNAFMISTLGLIFGWEAKLVIAGGILLFNGLTLRKLFQSTPNDPEHPLMAVRGWMNEREIGLLHNIAQAKLGWHDFHSVNVNDSCIWLQTHGARDRFILLQRRFFADDSQWQAAVGLARAHIQQSDQEAG